MSDLSESDVQRAQGGQGPARERLARAFLPRVYGLALRLSQRRDLADEATQETFLRVFRGLEQLRDPARLEGWVLTVTANVVRDLARRRRPEGSLQWEPPAIDVDTDDAEDARRKAIDRAVAGLPLEDRELFLLHTVEGVRLRVLARERETTEGTLKVKLHRIRTRVRARVLQELEAAGART